MSVGDCFCSFVSLCSLSVHTHARTHTPTQVENLKRRLSNKKQTADHDARELGSSVAELSADVADLTERNAALEDKYVAPLRAAACCGNWELRVEWVWIGNWGVGL